MPIVGLGQVDGQAVSPNLSARTLGAIPWLSFPPCCWLCYVISINVNHCKPLSCMFSGGCQRKEILHFYLHANHVYMPTCFRIMSESWMVVASHSDLLKKDLPACLPLKTRYMPEVSEYFQCSIETGPFLSGAIFGEQLPSFGCTVPANSKWHLKHAVVNGLPFLKQLVMKTFPHFSDATANM